VSFLYRNASPTLFWHGLLLAQFQPDFFGVKACANELFWGLVLEMVKPKVFEQYLGELCPELIVQKLMKLA
jgi:hypothetical protein